MSTSYGLACPEHDAGTGTIAQTRTGAESLAALWRIRGPLWAIRESPAWNALIRGHVWLCVDDADVAEDFIAAHRECAVEIVSEHGDRELPDDVADGHTEADADEIVRVVLERLGFPDDAIDRTCHAIVDALDGQRLLNYHRRPARLRGGLA